MIGWTGCRSTDRTLAHAVCRVGARCGHGGSTVGARYSVPSAGCVCCATMGRAKGGPDGGQTASTWNVLVSFRRERRPAGLGLFWSVAATTGGHVVYGVCRSSCRSSCSAGGLSMLSAGRARLLNRRHVERALLVHVHILVRSTSMPSTRTCTSYAGTRSYDVPICKRSYAACIVHSVLLHAR